MRVILIPILLAGCLASAPASDTLMPEPSYSMSGTGCHAVALGMLLNPGALDGVLPLDYQPRDAADLYDLPIAAGKHLLISAAMECPNASFALVSVYIQSPDHLYDLNASVHAFYDLAHVVPDENIRENVTRVGWETMAGSFNISSDELLPNSAIGTQSAFDIHFGAEFVQGSSIAALEYQELANATLRFYHHGAARVHFDVVIDTNAYLGHSTCTDSGWEFADEADNCEENNTLAVWVPDFTLDASLRRLP